MGFALHLKALLGETPHCWLVVWFLQVLVQKWSKLQNASKHASTIKYLISLPLWLPHSSLKTYFSPNNSSICTSRTYLNFQLLLAHAFCATVLDAKCFYGQGHTATPYPFPDLFPIFLPENKQKNGHPFSGKMAPVSFVESTKDKNALATAERGVQKLVLCSCTTDCCG